MNIPIKEYVELLKKTGYNIPEDFKFIENKELLFALIHKLLYINCETKDLPESVRELASEASQILHDLERDDSQGAVVTAYHRG